MTGSREHPEQIPTDDNEEETLRVLEKQESIPGERRDKAVCDVSEAAAVGQLLKDLHFPADKKRIVQFVEQSSRPESIEILSIVRNLKERQYRNVSDVAEAAGLVSK
jgi:predicted AAA+ superfamily ATPase